MTTKLTLRIYRDKKRELRWTLVARNGRKLSECGEGYKRRAGLEKDLFLNFMGNGFPCGKPPLRTMLAFRADIKLKDETA